MAAKVSVERYMSASVHCIGAEQTLARAHEVMREHAIRHLPVLKAGRLVGILSQRDLHLVETLPGADPEQITVDEAMTEDLYTVSADTDLREVVAEMAKRRLGSALVTKHGKVRGVFTTTDALRALTDVLGD
jgi:acetoin utilization protein AcuB